MIYQTSIFDNTPDSPIEKALKLIRDYEPIAVKRNPIGIVVGYSGGKDSEVLVDLFIKSGIKNFKIVHFHTTLDAPETVYFVRKKIAEWKAMGYNAEIIKPKINFWQCCIDHNMLPQRNKRFCCEDLKERIIIDHKYAIHAFGIRKTESVSRNKKRDSIEIYNRMDYKDIQKFHFDKSEDVKQFDACYTHKYFVLNPMAYWDDNTLNYYIQSYNIELNPLYAQGFKRIGCIGCPMAGKSRREEFKKYPKYKDLFIKTCDKIIRQRQEEGLPVTFANGSDYFDWWIKD